MLGAVYGSFSVPRSDRALSQLLAAAATLAIIVGAWAWTLNHAQQYSHLCRCSRHWRGIPLPARLP